MGQAQGLKTAKVAIGGDLCVVEDILASDGKTMGTATQAEKDVATTKAEEQVIVMLYLQNINQTWHSAMARYLEDAYATGNNIYPCTLPDAYRFLDDWKTRHRVKGAFAGRSNGVALANAQEQGQEGKRDP